MTHIGPWAAHAHAQAVMQAQTTSAQRTAHTQHTRHTTHDDSAESAHTARTCTQRMADGSA